MDDPKYRRLVQTSVTCFLYHGGDYLFIKRGSNKRVDPNRLNGIGGRVEPGENYLDAAIRETEEETGYTVNIDDVSLAGVVKLEGGYAEDWVMCFFKIKVPHKTIPAGNEPTEDGQLLWLDKDAILNSEYELVDDLNYCMQEIITGKELFFITAQLDDHEKIIAASTSKLRRVA